MGIAIVSCDSSDENRLPDTGTDYFPLRKGVFQVYDVTEVVYTLGEPETLTYELKVMVSDSFPNAEGGYSYVIYRSKRNQGNTEFVPLDTWSARKDAREIVVNEENISFFKIKLPVAKNEEWDGNLYNTKGEDVYTIQDVKTPYAVNGTVHEDCIVVHQNDNEDFVVSLDQRQEIYARHIGLIYKEARLLNYCSVGDCLGKQQVESGVIYTQSIKAHGVE